MSRLPRINGLTDKEVVFIEHILSGAKVYEAAIAAGYSPKTARVKGSQILNSDAVQAELKRLRLQSQAKVQVRRERVLERMNDILESTAEKAADIIMAAREINKMQGFYAVEKVEHSGQVSVVVEIPSNGRKAIDVEAVNIDERKGIEQQ